MLEKYLNVLENISNKEKENDTDNIKKRDGYRSKMSFDKTRALRIASIIMRTMRNMTQDN